jgi:hypothetical protein
MLPRMPARTRRTSQIPLEGPPVVPPREDVGGGVICGLLVAASTVPVGVGVGVGMLGVAVGGFDGGVVGGFDGGVVGGVVGGLVCVLVIETGSLAVSDVAGLLFVSPL